YSPNLCLPDCARGSGAGVPEDRQAHRETTAALSLVGHVAAMAARDLLYQREPKARSLGARRSADPVKWHKQSRALPLPDHRPLVADAKHPAVVPCLQADLYWRSPVAFGIHDEVANHAPQQHRIPPHQDRLSFDAAAFVSSAFLGREREQIDLLGIVQMLDGVKPTGEQYLVDQQVELGDIFLELGPAGRILLGKLEAEPNAGERRAQLVRCIGKQHLMSLHQRFDSVRGLVEAIGELRHLIATLDLD